VIISVGCPLGRCILGCLAVLARREVSKDAELLVLGHEKAVLRRPISRVRYRPGDRLWLATLTKLIPRANGTTPAAGTPGWPPVEATICERMIRIATGIVPAPRRAGPAWQQFPHHAGLRDPRGRFAHAGTVLLQRIYALIVIEHGTHRVHLADRQRSGASPG
jgi:putative transposase